MGGISFPTHWDPHWCVQLLKNQIPSPQPLGQIHFGIPWGKIRVFSSSEFSVYCERLRNDFSIRFKVLLSKMSWLSQKIISESQNCLHHSKRGRGYSSAYLRKKNLRNPTSNFIGKAASYGVIGKLWGDAASYGDLLWFQKIEAIPVDFLAFLESKNRVLAYFVTHRKERKGNRKAK